MRSLLLSCAALTALLATPLRAQDTTTAGPRAPVLRQRIEERFATRIKEQLKLNDDQMVRLRATSTKFGDRRRELEKRQLTVRRALAEQLRPGVAANRDSVARLTDDLVNGRVSYAETYKDELADLRTYLDPVQRAQLLAIRERLLRRAREFREGRGDADGGARGRRRPFMDR
ncbi:MAG: Spy/CpxP family protein refolding chaperone [Gemmatimonadales bacterium]